MLGEGCSGILAGGSRYLAPPALSERLCAVRGILTGLYSWEGSSPWPASSIKLGLFAPGSYFSHFMKSFFFLDGGIDTLLADK